jgi:transposase
MKIWLDKSLHQVPPKSVLGKALRYLEHEWPRLIPYVGDGRLPIDNNPCENAIRPFVIGRKIGCSPKARRVQSLVRRFTRS